MLYFIAIILICYLITRAVLYRMTTYYKITHRSYLSVRFNKGRYGEYLLYKNLKKQEKSGARFLFNIYLPKIDDKTTEIDVVFINETGVWVFESKNYSGWIFGNENQKNWTQCLPKGKNRPSQKEHFFNPIFQNKLHISAIKYFIGNEYPIYSVIAFSERCTLKQITVTNPMVFVINRDNVKSIVNSISSVNQSRITKFDIDKIYSTLYPFTQVSNETKKKHIEEIHNKTTEITIASD